jgi:hypothetical protein
VTAFVTAFLIGVVRGVVGRLVTSFLSTALALFRIVVFLPAAALDRVAVFCCRLEDELEDARLAGFSLIGRLGERAVFFCVIAERAVPVRRLVFRFAIVMSLRTVSGPIHHRAQRAKTPGIFSVALSGLDA